MKINFDMDGTLANFYGVPNWLNMLMQHNATPYAIAEPLINMSALARILNKLQKQGYEINVISWLSKNSTEHYDKMVTAVKKEWLKKHLHSVHFDNIYILPYGTCKNDYCETTLDILFDDEENNRNEWAGNAYDVNNIIEILKKF